MREEKTTTAELDGFEPAIRELDRSRRIGWARSYELADRLVEAESLRQDAAAIARHNFKEALRARFIAAVGLMAHEEFAEEAEQELLIIADDIRQNPAVHWQWLVDAVLPFWRRCAIWEKHAVLALDLVEAFEAEGAAAQETTWTTKDPAP